MFGCTERIHGDDSDYEVKVVDALLNSESSGCSTKQWK